MNASGGAAAPLNSASEEYGASAPRHELHGESDSTTSNFQDGSSSSSGRTADKTSTSQRRHQESSTGAASSQTTQSSSNSHHATNQGNDLEKNMREKAERYVNLDEEGDDHTSFANDKAGLSENNSRHQPNASHRGLSTEGTHHSKNSRSSDKKEHQNAGQYSSGSDKHGNHAKLKREGYQNDYEGHDFDQETRHKAEKFVNLED